MYLPQFTIRRLLIYVALAAPIFSILGFAADGRPWAIALSLALGAMVLMLLVHGAVFSLCWWFALTTGIVQRAESAATRSPFRASSGHLGTTNDASASLPAGTAGEALQVARVATSPDDDSADLADGNSDGDRLDQPSREPLSE